MSAPRGTSRLAARLGLAARLAAALGAAVAVASCASSEPAPRGNLDPLYHGVSGEGELEVDPRTAALARRGPARPQPPRASEPTTAEQPCAHDWEQVATHLFTDPSTGMPSLCAVTQCTKCGRTVHDCQRRWAR